MRLPGTKLPILPATTALFLPSVANQPAWPCIHACAPGLILRPCVHLTTEGIRFFARPLLHHTPGSATTAGYAVAMDVTDILPQLDRLDGEIDDLEEVLEPLLGSLPEVASKLPLLDKAKLYVLVTYALESMLFCKQHRSRAAHEWHPALPGKKESQTADRVLTVNSLPAPRRRQRQGAPGVQGADARAAVL